jgi:general secretion pathway protein D
VATRPAPLSPRALLKRKLDSIVIDKVDFEKADILQVIGYLQKKSLELDPRREGVNFVMRSDFTPQDHIHREVSLNVENASLTGLLNEISSQTNLEYDVEDYAVYLRPAGDEYNVFSVRTYAVPPGFFADVSGSSFASPVDVKNTLIAHGIHFPDGATAAFISVSGKLVVRNTPKQLDLIATLFDAYNRR